MYQIYDCLSTGSCWCIRSRLCCRRRRIIAESNRSPPTSRHSVQWWVPLNGDVTKNRAQTAVFCLVLFCVYLLVFFLHIIIIIIIIIIIDRQCVPMEYCVFRATDRWLRRNCSFLCRAARVQNDYPAAARRDTGRSQATAGATVIYNIDAYLPYSVIIIHSH
jgi:hypothetical protein